MPILLTDAALSLLCFLYHGRVSQMPFARRNVVAGA